MAILTTASGLLAPTAASAAVGTATSSPKGMSQIRDSYLQTSAAKTGAVAAKQMSVEVVLQPGNDAGLNSLLDALYTRGSAEYGDWLAAGQFEFRFAPSRATVHRVLVRNAMVTPQAQQHKRKYRRWARETPMALWQLDLVGGIYLADGRECKVLSGIDDHSRFVVCAAVLAVPSARAVADAFVAAMRQYGVPAEVLTDIQDGWCLRDAAHGPAGGARLPDDRRLPVFVTDRSERARARLLAC